MAFTLDHSREHFFYVLSRDADLALHDALHELSLDDLLADLLAILAIGHARLSPDVREELGLRQAVHLGDALERRVDILRGHVDAGALCGLPFELFIDHALEELRVDFVLGRDALRRANRAARMQL